MMMPRTLPSGAASQVRLHNHAHSRLNLPPRPCRLTQPAPGLRQLIIAGGRNAETVVVEVREAEVINSTPDNGHNAISNGNGANGHVANSNGATVQTIVVEPLPSMNGNGNANGNGNGHSSENGTGQNLDTMTTVAPKVIPSRQAIEAASAVVAATIVEKAATNAATAAALSSVPTNGASITVSTETKPNLEAKPPAKEQTVQLTIRSSTPMSTASLDEAIDAEAAGQVGTAAAQAESKAQRVKRSAAGTPYKAPGGRWSKFKSYSTFQRTLEIWGFAIQFAFKYALLNQKWTYGKEGMTKEAVSARKSELAIWLREGLVRLGPTFIKIGQQFSTRVDVLAPEFIKELEKLQDNVPPFDSATALDILQYNLGRPVTEVFDSFNPEPIAAASLGQVHLATLRGEKVVVKVQRPGLKELFDIDLKNIRQLAVWLQKVDPKTDGAARDWVAIYDECSRILYQEIDYTLEGKNADMFRENFKDVSWVKVPKVLWEFSSPEVLVLEYVPGVKINDAAALDKMGLDRKRLARLSVESYLQQILRHGFFHADPHPGNVAVDAQNGGRLIYYDFGMMGSIKPQVKEGLLGLFYGVYSKDPDRCLVALQQMGVYQPSGDATAVRRTADFFLKAFGDRLEEQKKERETKGEEYSSTYKPQRTKDEAKQRRKQILTSIGEDLLVAANEQPFRFPAAFTFVVRSFTVLDGIGKSLDPRFDISEIAAPYARELLLEGSPQTARLTKAFQKGLANQNRAFGNLFKAPNQIEDVAKTLTRLERGDLKLRVRALEAERALTRVQAWLRVIGAALFASTLVNVGTVLSVSAMTTGATASFVGAAFFGLQMLKNYIKVLQLEKKEAQLAGAV